MTELTPRQKLAVQIGLPLVMLAGVAAAAYGGRERTFVKYPEAEVRDLQNVHRYKGQPVCQRCHTYTALRRISGDPVALCTGCHPKPACRHPVGVRQLGSPARLSLPLGAGGEVQCHTCHDPHRVPPAAGLRAPPEQLCVACHARR